MSSDLDTGGGMLVWEMGPSSLNIDEVPSEGHQPKSVIGRQLL